MADEIAHLRIQVDGVGLDRINRDLDRLSGHSLNANRSTTLLMGTMGKYLPIVSSMTGAYLALNKVINTQRQFDILDTQLQTATGSAQNAEVAFEALRELAGEMPDSLADLTGAFVKLTNLGLDPSERALKIYSNTASAVGKSTAQLVEAVADAAVGEFERLKEFGIRTNAQGKNIKFTFQGITTEVGKNASEIEKYLLSIGEANFDGSVERRMETLDGAMLKFTDSWDRMFLNISQSGIGEEVEGQVRLATKGLDEINDWFESGSFEAHWEAFTGRFTGLSNIIKGQTDIAVELWDSFWQWVPSSVKSNLAIAFQEWRDFFTYLPQNAAYAINRLGIEFYSVIEYAKEYAPIMVDVFVNKFDELVQKAGVYGKAIAVSINPFSDENSDNLDQDILAIEGKYQSLNDKLFDSINDRIQSIKDLRIDSIAVIGEERTASIKLYETQMANAENLLKIYKQQRADRPDEDVLGQFYRGKDTTGTSYDETKNNKSVNDFRNVVDSLMTEEEAISESYKRRREIILSNTKENSDAQKDLLKRLNEDFAQESSNYFEKPENFQDQLTLIQEQFQARKELVLNNEFLIEDERTRLILEMTEERNRQVKELEMQRASQIMEAGATTFGALATIMKGYQGEQSSAYRKMFAVSKAFSLADATIKGVDAVQEAWASAPYPANIPAVASTTASTLSNVATIASTNFSGAYDNGGDIPAGKFGLVGEVGAELVEGPVKVTGRKKTEQMVKEAFNAQSDNGNGSGSNVNVKIINNLDPSIVGQYFNTDEGETAILNTIRNNPDVIQAVVNS